MLEFLVHRSAYQLKEADPHSWALPRLQRRAEGGAGRDPGRRVRRRPRPSGSTPQLFADAMRGARARPAYGAYLDRDPRRHARDGQPDVAVRPAPALARRDRRPPRAVRDDLVVAQPPLRQRAAPAGLRRATRPRFFDEHVEADAVHEAIAAVDLAGGLAARSRAAADILWGARALAALEGALGPPPARRLGGRPSSLRASATAPSGRLAAAVLGAARRPEARSTLVRAVAERPDAATCRTGTARRLAPERRSRCRPGREPERPAHEQRPVAVGGDRPSSSSAPSLRERSYPLRASVRQLRLRAHLGQDPLQARLGLGVDVAHRRGDGRVDRAIWRCISWATAR